MIEYGWQVRAIRAAKDLTRQEFASETGLSTSTLARLESMHEIKGWEAARAKIGEAAARMGETGVRFRAIGRYLEIEEVVIGPVISHRKVET